MQWVQDPERVDHEVSDTIELREGLLNGLETIKLTGLVPPIYFETGVAQIPRRPSHPWARSSIACATA